MQPGHIWDPLHECMPREEREQLQLERLQATLNRVYKNVPCYRTKFNELGIVPEDVASLSDLSKLPFTTKEDLRLNYPYGMFAVPLREVVRIHSSSGTTGKPTVVGYTKNDLKMWSNLVARIMTAAGVTHDDVVQIAFEYDGVAATVHLYPLRWFRVCSSGTPTSHAREARHI